MNIGKPGLNHMKPNWNQIVREHLTALRLSPEREIEIVEEIALHFEAIYDDARAAGFSETEAVARAVQSYDWRLLECELSRAERPLSSRALQPPLELIERRKAMHMESFIQDLRFGVRMLAKNPGFTLIAVLTLAAGISANTAIFSLVDAVLLRELPYREPDRVAVLWSNNAQFVQFPPTNADVAAWRARTQSFAQIAAFTPQTADLAQQDNPERVGGVAVTHEFFQAIGVEPVFGRAFTPEESNPDSASVGLISHNLWQRRFGADIGLLGREIILNGNKLTVIGILPPGFDFPRGAEMPAIFPFASEVDGDPLAMVSAVRAETGGSQSRCAVAGHQEGFEISAGGRRAGFMRRLRSDASVGNPIVWS
jgi:MacB-like periplasmic core domain